MTNPNLFTELEELGYIFVNEYITPNTFDELEIDHYDKRIEMSNVIDWLRVEHDIIVQVTYEGHSEEGDKPKFIADVYCRLCEGEEETTDEILRDYYEAKLDGIEMAVEHLKLISK
jgi:hypothetical protein